MFGDGKVMLKCRRWLYTDDFLALSAGNDVDGSLVYLVEAKLQDQKPLVPYFFSKGVVNSFFEEYSGLNTKVVPWEFSHGFFDPLFVRVVRSMDDKGMNYIHGLFDMMKKDFE